MRSAYKGDGPAATGSATEDNIIRFPGVGNNRKKEWRENSRRRHQFFSVDVKTVFGFGPQDVCLDLLTYLILASGSQEGGSTSWSAKAVQDRLQVRWTSCKQAIDRLVTSGRIERIPRDGAPRYMLPRERTTGEIWLPNALIDGAANETPPIKIMHQIGDIRATLFLLACYRRLDMAGCGGVSIDNLAQWYDGRQRVRHKPLAIWEFEAPKSVHIHEDMLIEAFGDERFDEERREVIRTLFSTGLLAWVPHLRTGGEAGSSLGAYTREAGEPEEREFGNRNEDRARELLRIEWGKQLFAGGARRCRSWPCTEPEIGRRGTPPIPSVDGSGYGVARQHASRHDCACRLWRGIMIANARERSRVPDSICAMRSSFGKTSSAIGRRRTIGKTSSAGGLGRHQVTIKLAIKYDQTNFVCNDCASAGAPAVTSSFASMAYGSSLALRPARDIIA